MTTLHQEFLSRTLLHFGENPPRIERCLALLTEDQVWQRPNSESNSVGNLILHLSGNIRQWICSSIGGDIDERVRGREFTTQKGPTKAELLELLNATVARAEQVVKAITTTELTEPREVQGFHSTVMGNIIHVVEHFSYHTGQIAFYTKLLTAQDLSFYADRDLDQLNG